VVLLGLELWASITSASASSLKEKLNIISIHYLKIAGECKGEHEIGFLHSRL
jgi:hypothetical protein